MVKSGVTFAPVEPFEGTILTSSGSIVGGIEFTGLSADTQDETSLAGLCGIDEFTLNNLDPQIVVWRAYLHYDGERARVPKHGDDLSRHLAQSREEKLNSKPIYRSRLVWLYEVAPSVPIKAAALRRLLTLDPKKLSAQLSQRAHLSVSLRELKSQKQLLNEVITTTMRRWGAITSSRQLDAQEMWQVMRGMATLDNSRFRSDEDVPEFDLSAHLLDGAAEEWEAEDGVKYVRIENAKPTYARLATMTALPKNSTPGFWSNLPGKGSYAVVTVWKQHSSSSRDYMLWRAGVAAKSSNIQVLKAMFGKMDDDKMKENRKLLTKQLLEEVDQAEASRKQLGQLMTIVCSWGNSPDEATDTSLNIKRHIEERRGKFVWERHGVMLAYAAIQPGGFIHSPSVIETELTAASEAAPLFCASRIEASDNEPYLLLTNREGGLMPIRQKINGRAFDAKIGQTRSGKSVLIATEASFLLGYGAQLVMISPDMGFEPLAAVYGDRAGVFNFEKGLNLMAACRSSDDRQFMAHVTELAALMCSMNISPELQVFKAEDELDLQEGLKLSLRAPKETWQLSSLAAYLKPRTREKLKNWLHQPDANLSGMYAPLFDNLIDGPGVLTKPLNVYNLHAYKNDKVAFKAILSALFYRVRLAFEDAKNLGQFKKLYIDEAHIFADMPDAVKFVEQNSRMGGKWHFGMGLATQAPSDLADAKGWPAIRTSLSTLYFFADRDPNRDLYRNGYQLSDGAIDCLKTLEPRREVLIVQPELEVYQVARLDLTEEEEVIATSKPEEVSVRNEVMPTLIESHGIKRGLKETYKKMKGAA